MSAAAPSRHRQRLSSSLQIADLKVMGFEGFTAIKSLWKGRISDIPQSPGVYVVIRPAKSAPRFRKVNPAFRFKGRDPSEPRVTLKSRWLPTAQVVYIGKAGRQGGKANLRVRIGSYLRSGRGLSSAHWGGRAIWHLADADRLIFAWMTTTSLQARTKEKSLIATFRRLYGARPFANLTG
jgi:hypothetical protein